MRCQSPDNKSLTANPKCPRLNPDSHHLHPSRGESPVSQRNSCLWSPGHSRVWTRTDTCSWHWTASKWPLVLSVWSLGRRTSWLGRWREPRTERHRTCPGRGSGRRTARPWGSRRVSRDLEIERLTLYFQTLCLAGPYVEVTKFENDTSNMNCG